jgi:signal transduction histidine kinase
MIAGCHATAVWAQQEDMSTIFDFSHILAYVVAGLLIGLFVMLFENRLICFKERRTLNQFASRNAQLAMVLDACKVTVWTYDVKSRRYRLLSREGAVEGEYAPIDFSQFFERDDFERLRAEIFRIAEGAINSKVTSIGGRKSEHGRQKQYEISLKVLEHDRDKRPSKIIGLQHDVTEELHTKQHVNQMLSRYRTVFDQSLIDMIYYDAQGVMTDINDRACQTFGISDRQHFLDARPTMESNPGFASSGFDGSRTIHFTTIIDQLDLKDVRMNGRMYYEMEYTAVHNAQGDQIAVFSAGRNVSENVENQHRQREAIRLLRQATANIEDYIRNINFVLRVGDVRLMNYSPETHILKITNDLNQAQYQLTQMRCLALVQPQSQHHAWRILRQMDRRASVKIEQRLCTIIRDQQGRDVWLSFSIMPIYDKQGRVDHYFGMCRNETEMVATEHQLQQETLKAQETETLKDSFLTNMSYEIRTPLNAVLGFASLLNSDHDVSDEPVFVEEIKGNANKLLTLVNDVLYLSRLDARMVEFNYQPFDFAASFEIHCQTGWAATLGPGVKTVIENPYNHLVVEIDDQNLGEVIRKLCANATYYTTEGTVRAKYEYRRGALNITIEDTGAGIDSETLEHVFDRFVTNYEGEHCGTGLGLPIVKELVEQMGGVLDMSSELGKGTTAWVTIPCKLIEFDKKKEILA